MSRFLLQLTGVAMMGLSIGCSSSKDEATHSDAQSNNRPIVFAANYPLLFMGSAISDGSADFLFPFSEDEDPAFWSPTPEDIRAMQKADLFLFNGATYEKWANQVTIPTSRIVRTAAGFRNNWLEIGETVTHSHGPGGEHSHAGVDFNTWLDPLQASQQAEEATKGLEKILPEKATQLRANLANLQQRFNDLHDAFHAVTTPINQPLLASHPVYGYFARRYDLRMESVTWEPGEMPDESQWAELDEILKTHPAVYMIWEDTPIDQISLALMGRGIQPIVFRTANNRPQEGDYFTVMQENIRSLTQIQPSR